MPDTAREPALSRIVFHNDDSTPRDFVIALLREVFGQSESDADAFAAAVDREGRNAFGAYPSDVAQALLAAAEQRIKARGHALKLTVEAIPEMAIETGCSFCGKAPRPTACSIRVAPR